MTSNADAFDQWIRRYHPSSERGLRLISLPHAGGSASAYFALSAAMAPSVEVWSVQYPGRQDHRRGQFCTDAHELAGHLAQALQGRLDQPYALFGHSMGAAVAFELTRLLEQAGQGPEALVVSGRRAPSTVRDEQVHLRDDAGIVRELRLLSGTDPVFLRDPELLAMILPVLRADYRVIETYAAEPGAAVATPVTALVGADDPKTTVEEARAWSRHASGAFDLRVFPGGHFFLDEQLPQVVDTLRNVLLSVPAAGDSKRGQS